jgi:RimJ/RimL family protein N-acetyltransferase
MVGPVELQVYTDADMALTEEIECDPEMMRELGGPLDEEKVPELHRKRLAGIASGDTWWFKIVPDPPGPAAGTIGIWETGPSGNEIHEIGWMVLPGFQGRGIASRALDMILSRARSDPRYEKVHAFPAVSNAPSNALCRKFGFSKVGERDFEFRGSTLRCNHWELDVSE